MRGVDLLCKRFDTLLELSVAEWYFRCAIVLSQFVGIVFCAAADEVMLNVLRCQLTH